MTIYLEFLMCTRWNLIQWMIPLTDYPRYILIEVVLMASVPDHHPAFYWCCKGTPMTYVTYLAQRWRMLLSEKAYKVTYVSKHTYFPISYNLVFVELAPTSLSTPSSALLC
jgi:hypothetical protein